MSGKFTLKNKPAPEIEKLDHISCPCCKSKGGMTVQNNLWHCEFCDAEGVVAKFPPRFLVT